MNFGVYPLISLLDARSKRDEAYALLQDGHDPAVAKKLKVEANLEAGRQTFELIARQWYENARSQWAAIHAADVIRSLERDVFPAIGGLPVSQLTPPLVMGVLREIEARGSIETAKRVSASPPSSFTPSPRASLKKIPPRSLGLRSSRCVGASNQRSPRSWCSGR
jgi:hypothetical protein